MLCLYPKPNEKIAALGDVPRIHQMEYIAHPSVTVSFLQLCTTQVSTKTKLLRARALTIYSSYYKAK